MAEKVTGRFLNVIGLFNGFVPLIAIQLRAVKLEDKIGLIFTKVLDELPLGRLEEKEGGQEPTDRAYWESKGSRQTVELADRMLDMIQSFASGYKLNYTKHYIGLAKNGQANNFVVLKPQKTALRFKLKLPKTEETSGRLEGCDLEMLEYDHRWRCYKFRLSSPDLSTHEGSFDAVDAGGIRGTCIVELPQRVALMAHVTVLTDRPATARLNGYQKPTDHGPFVSRTSKAPARQPLQIRTGWPDPPCPGARIKGCVKREATYLCAEI